jgi:hypothetical protein
VRLTVFDNSRLLCVSVDLLYIIIGKEVIPDTKDGAES